MRHPELNAFLHSLSDSIEPTTASTMGADSNPLSTMDIDSNAPTRLRNQESIEPVIWRFNRWAGLASIGLLVCIVALFGAWWSNRSTNASSLSSETVSQTSSSEQREQYVLDEEKAQGVGHG